GPPRVTGCWSRLVDERGWKLGAGLPRWSWPPGPPREDLVLDSPDVDFALAAFHVDGAWQVAEIAGTALVDLDTLAAGLRRFPADGGALAMIGLDEETFLLVRANGPRVRVLLSDVTAADEWDLARDVVEHLGLPFP